VDEWSPEALCEPLAPQEQAELASVPVIVGAQGPKPKIASTGKTALNLAAYNFTGLQGNETIRQRAIDTVREYGVGSCGPSGFYGTLGGSGLVHKH
jgi:serine palmitoyltransferase